MLRSDSSDSGGSCGSSVSTVAPAAVAVVGRERAGAAGRGVALDRAGRGAARAAGAGFTLIEVMIVLIIVGLLAAFAYPAYIDYVVRGYRSEGQQFLQDLAQRQEQYFLDRRAYAASLGLGANQLRMTFPEPGTSLDQRYDPPTITPVAGPPPGFIACLQPLAGGPMAARGDGGLCVDATGLRWRDMNSNGTFEAGTDRAWGDR